MGRVSALLFWQVMGTKNLRHSPYSGLWIGSLGWPDNVAAEDSSSLQLLPGILISEAQIGGLFCDHKRLFGFLCVVPETDPLFQLGLSYYGSNLPGRVGDIAATPLDAVTRLRSLLRVLGLDADPIHYSEFAEAFIPIDPALAWAHCCSRRFEIHDSYDERQKAYTFCTPDYIGLSEWPKAEAHLESGWRLAASASSFEYMRTTPAPDRWTAALVMENSD